MSPAIAFMAHPSYRIRRHVFTSASYQLPSFTAQYQAYEHRRKSVRLNHHHNMEGYISLCHTATYTDQATKQNKTEKPCKHYIQLQHNNTLPYRQIKQCYHD